MLELGIAERAIAGEWRSGDRAVLVSYQGGALAAAIDGLGHGVLHETPDQGRSFEALTAFTGRPRTTAAIPAAVGEALRSALLAGGLLAFALSFDEIIVTTFTAGSGVTTLPIFILNNMFRPAQAPVVSVIAVVLVIVSIVPIYLAQRLSGSEQTRR